MGVVKVKANWRKSAYINKRMLVIVFGILLTALFVLWPLPPAALHIRFFFDEISGDECVLYYTTDIDGEYSEDQCIVSPIEGGKQVDFYLDAFLAGHIQYLRIDWPDRNQLLCVKSVTVSSAGVIQKEFDPCDFFSDIAFQNDILDQSLVRIRDRAYILTDAEDPYMIFGETTVNQIQDCFSQYRLTRFAICLFLFGCFYFGKRELFVVSGEGI